MNSVRVLEFLNPRNVVLIKPSDELKVFISGTKELAEINSMAKRNSSNSNQLNVGKNKINKSSDLGLEANAISIAELIINSIPNRRKRRIT